MKRKIITLVLTFTILCGSMGVVNAFSAGRQTVLDNYTSPNLNNTTHIYSKQETSDYIVKNNSTDYILVIPESENSGYVYNVSKDFTELLYESTGAKIVTKRDTELGNWTQSAKIISLGDTKQLKAAKVSYTNKDLGICGFIIKTVGKSIFIAGEQSFGTMCGAYELLTQLVNFREYGHNATYYDSVDDVKLFNFDITDKPDFEMPKDPCDDTGSSNNRERMRFLSWGDYVMSVPGYGSGHSSFGYVDPEKYAYATIKDEDGNEVVNENYHPEWFWYKGDEPVQLSLSAHGNEESRKQMLQVALDVLISIVNDNPNVDAVSFAQQDDDYADSADSARAEAKYGQRSGEWVEFCNDLQRGLKAHFAANNIDRKVKIFFYSYTITEKPPIRNGEPTIKADDGVVCMFCPIFQDESESIVSLDNAGDKANLDGWLKVCDEVWVWFYNACYYNYMYPRFSFNGILESMRYAQSVGAKMYMLQSQTYSYKLWAFGELQNYLLSRGMWDTTLDQEELTNDWFAHYYGEVSPYMKEIYNLMETNYNYWNHTDSLHNGTDGYAYQTAKVWPLALLNQLIALTDKALDAIEIYKTTDPALYSNLYEKIMFERIPFQYAIVQLYSSYFSDEYILALKKEVKKVATRIGALYWRENSPITGLWELWGV